MDLEIIGKEYGISVDTLICLINQGILDDLTKTKSMKSYEGLALERLKSCVCLHSIGMEQEAIKTYLLLSPYKKDTPKKQKLLLQEVRVKKLHEMHQIKETLDGVDWVLKNFCRK